MNAHGSSSSRLAVLRDGIELPEDQARALWRAFSEHMDRNRDDLDGFARDHGFVSVRAEHRRGRAVLIVSSMASIPPPPKRSDSGARPPVRATARPARTAQQQKRRTNNGRGR
jgi:hypothetical protein